MNWLAHLYLSEPDPGFRLGNVLPDLVPGRMLLSLPSGFQRGIAQHRRIDAFTDAHPVFRRSVQRIDPPYRRFGGILCDLFYDHFLASEWESHATEPLTEFAHSFYDSFEPHRAVIPVEAYVRLERMRAGDWLCSYKSLEAISLALDRIGSQFGRPVLLSPAVAVLERDYDAFYSDFRAFFPEIQRHLADGRS